MPVGLALGFGSCVCVYSSLQPVCVGIGFLCFFSSLSALEFGCTSALHLLKTVFFMCCLHYALTGLLNSAYLVTLKREMLSCKIIDENQITFARWLSL